MNIQYHIRQRKNNNLAPYPHPAPWKGFLDKIIYVVGITTPIILLPQLIEVWSSHNVAGLSLMTWMGFGFINLLWFLYGIIHKENPIIIANGLLTFMNFAVATGIIIFS